MTNCDKSSRPEITWSLMHPTPLDAQYMRRVIAAAASYPVDSFEICAQCHTLLGGMDGLILYEDYPSVSQQLDRQGILDNRENFRQILSLAHAAGKPVYYWHREVIVPKGLVDVMPELLDANGEFNLLGEAYEKLLRYKLRSTFEALPELDGLVLTLTEADYSAIHNSTPDVYPPEKVVQHVTEIFADELRSRGKRFILRSFGSIAEDYDQILAGAALAAKNFSFEIETKITPYDFDPFLPLNPFLRKQPGATLGAECDCVGEFMGAGNFPLEHIEKIVGYVRAGQAAGVDRWTIRIDRIGNSAIDISQQNLYAYMTAICDTTATAQSIRTQWKNEHYPQECREQLAELDRLSFEAAIRTYFIDGQVIFHGNYSMKYLKAGFVFALFQPEGGSLEMGKGVWSIITTKPAPGRQNILKEKDKAVELADKGYEIASSLGEAAGFRLQLWDNARRVTRSIRELCRCICAYFDDMEAGDAEARSMKAAIATAREELNRLSGHDINTHKRSVLNGLEHRHKEVNRSLEEICMEPIAAILQELPEEFEAEWNARKRFMAGAVDCVITGALTCDYRIGRYMHASHAMIYNGRPSRWAGNQVFPNGFFDLKMKPGKTLHVYGAPEEAAEFMLTCNGVKKQCKFNDAGEFEMALPEAVSVELRFEKAPGFGYPRFFAVVVR